MSFYGKTMEIDSTNSSGRKDLQTLHFVAGDTVEVADLSKVPVLNKAVFIPASIDIGADTIVYDVISGSGTFGSGRMFISAVDGLTDRIVNVSIDPTSSANVTEKAISFGNDYVFIDFRGLQYDPNFRVALKVVFDTAHDGRPSYGDMDASTYNPSTPKVGTDGNDVIAFRTTQATAVGMDAGRGVDTLVLEGTADLYRVNREDNGLITVGRLTADRDIFDTGSETLAGGFNRLENFERLQFANGRLALDTGYGEHAGTAYRTYEAAFDRAPDAGGLAFHINNLDNGYSFVDMANGFVNSPEFMTRYGTAVTNAAYVDALYQNTLGRAGEAAGVAYWNNLLDSGRATKADVLIGFADSPENMANLAAQTNDGVWLL